MYSISELMREFLADKDLKPSTQQSYNVACRALIRRLGDCIVEEIDRKSVIEWRKDVLRISIKEVSWNTYMRHLRGMFNFGLKRGLIGVLDNPFADCAVRCPTRPCKTVSQEDIQRARNLLSAMIREEDQSFRNGDLYPAWFWSTVFDTFCYTGIRANELISLRVQDIDLNQGVIRVTAEIAKNYKERVIPIHDLLMAPLEKLIAKAKDKKINPGAQLFNVNAFSNRHNKALMDMDQVGAFYKRLSSKLGARYSPHRFRHTLASEMMREPDRNIQTVKELLGHSHINTTMGYVSVNIEQMRGLLNEVR